MKKITVYAFAIAIVIASACKKNKDTSAVSLQGKWGLVNLSYQEIDNGVINFTYNYTGVAADYIDFRNDSKVYSFIDCANETVDYAIINNNKVMIDGDAFDIQTLTQTNCKLYQKNPATGTTYDETIVNLKR